MRIVGGEHRGRRIAAPAGCDTRPMLDRVRESLFATIQPWIPGALVLDLFAGSGSLGLEALSRGARRARFVERGAQALRVLHANVAALSEESRTEVIRGDALERETWGADAPDVVFFDPPYALLNGVEERRRLFDALRCILVERAAPEAVLVYHLPRGVLRPEHLPAGLVGRARNYGSSTLWYIQADDAGSKPALE